MDQLSRSLPLERLSPAERRVFDLALDGRRTQDIAVELVVTEATVRSHLTRIYAKLEVQGRIDLLGQVASQRGSDANRSLTIDASPSSDMPSWATISLAAGALAMGIILPPSSIVLGPALITLGFIIRRRASHVRRWPWIVVLVSGAILGVEALVLSSLLFGLATAGA
ncbi:MAG TPA: LuxR C-terminal-related transcriptional regulator [Gemmatimonadales bacterium]|nr:LuxR C-terminal-related transcriptional regulator [Gemmatimonadales bacterium]